MRSDMKAGDFNNYMQTNHRATFQSHDNNITKKKAMAGKLCKNNKINKSLLSNLRYLETIKTDKMEWIPLIVIKKIPQRLK